MPDNIMSWGQLALYAAGALALIIWSFSTLLKVMGTTYVKINSDLQQHVASQDTRIAGLETAINNKEIDWQARFDLADRNWQARFDKMEREYQGRLDKSDRDCDQKINALRSEYRSHIISENTKEIQAVKQTVAQVESKATVASDTAIRLAAKVEDIKQVIDTAVERRATQGT